LSTLQDNFYNNNVKDDRKCEKEVKTRTTVAAKEVCIKKYLGKT